MHCSINAIGLQSCMVRKCQLSLLAHVEGVPGRLAHLERVPGRLAHLERVPGRLTHVERVPNRLVYPEREPGRLIHQLIAHLNHIYVSGLMIEVINKYFHDFRGSFYYPQNLKAICGKLLFHCNWRFNYEL